MTEGLTGWVGESVGMMQVLRSDHLFYLLIKHIHIHGRKQDTGTGQQGTDSTLTVGLHKACNYCKTFPTKSIKYTLQTC